MICFHLLLIGSKIAVAVLVGRQRDLLTGKAYPYVMRLLAIALVIFAYILFRDALEFLAVPRV